MYQEERMNKILEYLKINKRIKVDEICKMCNVSRDTARRDLVNLEKEGAILRTHGGAILPNTRGKVKNYEDRLLIYPTEKKLIAKLATSLIKNTDKLIMDSSTTVQIFAEMLEVENLSVITNSINLAHRLSKKANIDIHLLGGILDCEYKFLYGPSTIDMLSNYFADKACIGALGISEKGITVAHAEDASVMKKMIEQSNETIVLVDHSKFGNNGFFKVCDLCDIDLIVTDKLPNKDLTKIFEENNIDIMAVNEKG
ncbi:DeoR/GlpR family DNA-binding transcription regulator [Clostridium botulinum]|uniref:DeoR/GlpR family DNA-binding transcription regulator n=1 Tax=Clostridium botulinum TaxID=1491 RepID=UPI0007DFAEDA|nr:DeoR/GlpR family DNA-binding transcription regulator [Clostridium botulinum]KEI97832.1 DeoR faimly transcriptional regulator [Clostridium botulinum F 357]